MGRRKEAAKMLHDVCNAVNIYSRTPREERVHPLYWGSVSRRNINNSREGGKICTESWLFVLPSD